MLIRFHFAIDGGSNMSSIPNDQAAAKAYDGFGIASFALATIAMLSFGMLPVYATAFNTSGAMRESYALASARHSYG
jgi:hypothetical protein